MRCRLPPDAVFCAKDGAKLGPEDAEGGEDHDPYIGTVISGDIEIRSVAGAGSMGRVYRAFQGGIERDVAVKILHRELSRQRRARGALPSRGQGREPPRSPATSSRC